MTDSLSRGIEDMTALGKRSATAQPPAMDLGWRMKQLTINDELKEIMRLHDHSTHPPP